ncbi:MAG: hypothetical protein DME25_09310, partial [Verrucomicrobia bacterium]
MGRRVQIVLLAVAPATGLWAAQSRTQLPSLDEIVQSKADLWGEAAMREPNGATYEFFEGLLPPPRYVNADFRFYPIVLSAPNAKVKARLISNGSGINLRGGARSWNDVGTPVLFRVGPDEFAFGGDRERLSHPTLAEGYLPIVEIRYQGRIPFSGPRPQRAPEHYRLEAFASTDPALAENGIVLVKFSLAAGTNGIITVQVDSRPVKFSEGKITDESGHVLVYFDETWTWERGRAHARIGTNRSATVAIPTKLVAGDIGRLTSAPKGFNYEEQRQKCVRTWKELLAQGMN